MIDESKLEEWTALEAAATPGPMVAELDMFDSEDGIVALVTDARTNLLMSAQTDIISTPQRYIDAENEFGDLCSPRYRGPKLQWTAEDEAAKNDAWRRAKESQALKDARFYAAARAAVPALLAEVKRLRAEVEMLRGVGCSEDGDGPCGVCLKCARAEVKRLKNRPPMSCGNCEDFNLELADENRRLEHENADLRAACETAGATVLYDQYVEMRKHMHTVLDALAWAAENPLAEMVRLDYTNAGETVEKIVTRLANAEAEVKRLQDVLLNDDTGTRLVNAQCDLEETHANARLAHAGVLPYEAWPLHQTSKYNGSGEPCDMWTGPCSCGAWHTEGR